MSGPDMHTNPTTWERDWDHKLLVLYGPQSVAKDALDDSMLAMLASTPVETDALSNMWDSICKLQHDLAKRAVPELVVEGFEDRWLAAGAARREELVLDALAKTCAIDEELERHRFYCPDLTVRAMEKNEGRGYIAMLKALLPSQGSEVISPIHVEDRAVLEMFKAKPTDLKERPKTQVQVLLLTRTYFLSLVVWHTLLAFDGQSETPVPMVPKVPSMQAQKKLRDALASQMGKRAATELVRETIAEQRENRTPCCRTCMRPSVPGDAFKKCAKCAKAGRTVMYCSRECQVKDWKMGEPRPHKLTCGVPVDGSAEAASAQASGDDDDNDPIPRPDPGYRWSPALLHQIKFLRENPRLDYVLVRPSPHPDFGVCLAHPMGRIMFLMARRRAMQHGDEKSINMMYDMLLPNAEQNRISSAKLRKQLEDEYGVAVTPKVGTTP